MVRQRRSIKVADLLGDDGDMVGEMGDLGRAFAAALSPAQDPSVSFKSPFGRHEGQGSTAVEASTMEKFAQAGEVERR